MRVLYTSDLHGNISLYQQLVALARSSMVELLIIGGDLLPSFSPSKKYEDMISHQRTFIDGFLLPFFERMIDDAIPEQIFLIPGNWDVGYFCLFRRSLYRLVDGSQKHFKLANGYEIMGYPFVPPTPFRPKDFEKMDDRSAPWPPQKTPSYIRSPDQPDKVIQIDPHLYLKSRETIEEDLNCLGAPSDPRKTIYVMHSPPFETKLDQIEGGQSTGSRSIRRFIERTQPLLTLHGHIHESPELSGSYTDFIGKTLCVNPGQFGEASGRLYAVIFELENPNETLRHTYFQPRF